MATTTIRLFRPADQHAVKTLVLAGLSEYFEQLDPTLNLDLIDIGSSYPWPANYFFVAENEGLIIGTGALMQETPRRGRIVRVSVAPDFRRKGIARRLVETIMQTARMRGLSQLVVETNDDWYGAIHLYLNCGFTPVALYDGELHFALDLRSRAST